MRRPLSIISFILLLALGLGAWAYAQGSSDDAIVNNSGSVPTFRWGGMGGSGTMPSKPLLPPEVQHRIYAITSASLLRWPDKKISLRVKDTGIQRIAEMLSAQTGIKFHIKPGMPADLKITLQVSEMGVKQFLDMLCGATNLTYVAESYANSKDVKPSPGGNVPHKVKITAPTLKSSSTEQGTEVQTQGKTRIEAKTPPDGGSQSKVQITALELNVNKTGQGYEFLSPNGASVYVFGPNAGNPVTDVTISSLAAEGVVVNMGMVAMSVRDADPVEVATKLIEKIPGAGYMIMGLKDYLALQDPDRAAQIERSVKTTPRQKVTMTLREQPITLVLMQLAQKGHFYITMPQGASSYLIIPDVQVVDATVLPPLSDPYAITILDGQKRAQEICLNYMKKMADQVLKYAQDHDGMFPDPSRWIELVPVVDPNMTGSRYQYAYAMNKYLSGKRVSDIPNPAKTVLLFESNGSLIQGTIRDVAIGRHPGGANYAFADGHTEFRGDVPAFGPR